MNANTYDALQWFLTTVRELHKGADVGTEARQVANAASELQDALASDENIINVS